MVTAMSRESIHEKSYGSWGRDYGPEWWPHENCLEGLIKTDKDFLNKNAYLALADHPVRETLKLFEIDADTSDASVGEPIFLSNGAPVGQVTSGAHGYHVDKSLALGYIKAGAVAQGEVVHITVLGRPHEAWLLAEAPFNPCGTRLRDLASQPKATK